MNRLIVYLVLFISLLFCEQVVHAQVCGTPGFDGPFDIGGQVNTYYPAAANTTLTAGATAVALTATPSDVVFSGGINTYSANGKSISNGDLLLIIQMQDATINSSNSKLYGDGTGTSGLDGLGGTGYTNLGNTGLFEYVVATNDVPLTGGILTFRGAGAGRGVVNTYYNADFNPASTTQGQRSFQVVRVPQYSNVKLIATIYAPPFNGKAGGIIAFDVTGEMNFNDQTIDASARGFRGGFVYKHDTPNSNDCTTYVSSSSNTTYNTSGKGEGIVGSPRFLWDGFVQVGALNDIEGLPIGSFGIGAPGNGGGGGNAHNSGGGGGGNGGYGGVGGNGVFSNCTLSGGRFGSITYPAGTPNVTRLIMGGGGGSGEVNDADLGNSGGVGGGIIILNVGSIIGSGSITTNGGAGQSGGWCDGKKIGGVTYTCVPNDGGGGGGAGGTVFLKVSNPSSAAMLTINANGGDGGSCAEGVTGQHGPGGGGGGGLILYSNNAPNTIIAHVSPGAAGVYNGNGFINSHNGASSGTFGKVVSSLVGLPSYLEGGGSVCYPELSAVMSEANHGVALVLGAALTYTVTVSNKAGVGNAAGAIVDVLLPSGITYQSVTITYTGESGGDIASFVTTNQGTATNPRFGNFLVAPGGAVVLTLTAKVQCTTISGIYNSHAQTYYLDPTRILAHPYGHITPATTVFDPPPSSGTFSASTVYASGGSVLGSNFNGFLSTAENVNVNGLTIISNSPVYVGNTIRLDSSIPGETYSWTGPKGQKFTSKSIVIDNADETMAGIYTLTISVHGCLLEASVNVIVRGKIIVPNIFTPNGDGIEDTWNIQGLENYPEERTVRVFDIWGVLVFSSVGYKQPWDGTYHGRDLPVATYYYVIDPKDDTTPLIAGYVAIVR